MFVEEISKVAWMGLKSVFLMLVEEISKVVWMGLAVLSSCLSGKSQTELDGAYQCLPCACRGNLKSELGGAWGSYGSCGVLLCAIPERLFANSAKYLINMFKYIKYK